ncbi:hypothetical protein SLH46_02100 [Draconibacterium sp. IB214405]|uniref:hypothetical protein n=1 Tax=Draconibacterium sp. IB214405 TaxID=3097352 RepID=UPI002A14CBEF|nr:hypothetical protein [Draconibacterium sp. IB214405]MDX8337956.1 hypothetical protein [Draconibacterium sp. IB214405]
MKKRVILLIAVLMSAAGSGVFAQGSGTAPQVGSKHNYAVTYTAGNSYVWDVTSDFAGNTTVVGTLVTITAGTDDANIDVTWNNAVPGTTYFVHVTETADDCSNRKVLAVTPVNNFTLDIVSVDLDDADTDNEDNYAIVPSSISIDGYDAAASTFTYNYHKDSVFYKITAAGIDLATTDWSPQFTISHEDITGTVVSAGWATAIDGTYTMGLDTDGGVNDLVVETSATTNGEIWIKVVVDNSTLNEGLVANSIVVNLVEDPDDAVDNSNQSGEDENGNDVTSTGNDTRTQIVKARPATSDISTD